MHQKFQYFILSTRMIIVTILIGAYAGAFAQYDLKINYADKDSLFQPQALKIQTKFSGQTACADYINKLSPTLNLQGYAAASIDAVMFNENAAALDLYLGKKQNWIKLNTVKVEKKALEETGFLDKSFNHKPFNINQITLIKERIVGYYERNGYPFASVFLDSILLNDETMAATLAVKKGPLYHIDSISVKGTAKISNAFLQQYLSITNGSIYNQDKLNQVSKKLLELPYLQEQQPSELSMLGTGSVLNLYLLPKRSSQVNFLIGFLPSNNETGKLQLTGDVNLNLKNALGAGETILLNWQQLQLKSPRLNIGFQQPYIFKSPFGVDFSFDIFKKDSAYLQLNAQFGVQYLLSANQSGKLFIQQQNTFLLGSGVDTNQVKLTKSLPLNIDVSALNFGIDYSFNNTNYRFNPLYGNEISLFGTIGLKTISKNNDILSLTDPSFNYATLYDSIKLKSYQFRIKGTFAHYLPTGKRSTLKLIMNAGIYNSPVAFRNELFQIGGYKLLRGFDEESIYTTQFIVPTAEYRYLIGLNSYLYGFIDAGWTKSKYQSQNFANSFISSGLGLLFETKLGLLNMSFAIGKRNDVNFNLSNAAKIHFGYINYF